MCVPIRARMRPCLGGCGRAAWQYEARARLVNGTALSRARHGGGAPKSVVRVTVLVPPSVWWQRTRACSGCSCAASRVAMRVRKRVAFAPLSTDTCSHTGALWMITVCACRKKVCVARCTLCEVYVTRCMGSVASLILRVARRMLGVYCMRAQTYTISADKAVQHRMVPWQPCGPGLPGFRPPSCPRSAETKTLRGAATDISPPRCTVADSQLATRLS